MQRDYGTTAAEWSPVTRRQALLGIGTVASAGVGLGVAGSGSARAQVSVDGLDVGDASFEAESVDPVVDVEAGYSYNVGNSSVKALDLALLVDDDVVDTRELTTSTQSLENDTALSGPITDSGAWSADDFAVEPGQSVERDVAIEVTFDVIGTGDGVVASASADDTATVVVDHPQDSAYTVSVGGVGEIVTEG